MTEQEIFDTASKGMLKQGCRSLAPGFPHHTCVYRGDNNTKCAVGFILTDKEVTEEVEAIGAVRDLYEANLLPERLIPYKDLLSDLQRIHDNTELSGDALVNYWKEQLTILAERYNLKVNF